MSSRVLACGHDAAAFGAPLCPHFLTCDEAWLRCMRWYRGAALDHEVLCLPCAEQREAGAAVAAHRVCEPCCRRALDELAVIEGVRGEPGIATRAAPLSTARTITALPAELGAIADLAPIDGAPGASWLVLAASGAVIRFDAGTGAWTVVAECSVPAEPDAVPWAGRALRRRLHVSLRGEFAAVVNDHGRRGQVLDLAAGRVTMALDGGGYHPETVPFALAFFEARGRTVVVHRTDWNRLDLSDPATGARLTPRESPVIGADRATPPHYLDYFHGALLVDPTGRRVVDDGWIWHPVGVPVAFSLARWHAENPWESEDGPTRLELCARDACWGQAIAWLDDERVAVSGLGDDDATMVPGARIFDVAQRGDASPGQRSHAASARELCAFPGPAGQFFAGGGWLFSSSETGLSRWDPTTGERTGHIADFQPSHHHRGARELVQVVDGHLVRLVLPPDEDRAAAAPR